MLLYVTDRTRTSARIERSCLVQSAQSRASWSRLESFPFRTNSEYNCQRSSQVGWGPVRWFSSGTSFLGGSWTCILPLPRGHDKAFRAFALARYLHATAAIRVLQVGLSCGDAQTAASCGLAAVAGAVTVMGNRPQDW